jgi:hypothetical protein
LSRCTLTRAQVPFKIPSGKFAFCLHENGVNALSKTNQGQICTPFSRHFFSRSVYFVTNLVFKTLMSRILSLAMAALSFSYVQVSAVVLLFEKSVSSTVKT